jgi:hypothetical protein
MPRRAQNSSSAGRTIVVSIHRQFPSTDSSAVDTNPHSVTPTGHHTSSPVSTRPRYLRGENSLTSA